MRVVSLSRYLSSPLSKTETHFVVWHFKDSFYNGAICTRCHQGVTLEWAKSYNRIKC